MICNRTANGQHWGVVGGGMLGLTLAHGLARRGHRVTVLEAAPQIGGLAAAWQIGEITWDRHYHVTLLSDLRLRQLLQDLGLEKEIRWVETKTGFFSDGQLHSMSNVVEFLRFPPLGVLDKVRLGVTIWATARRKNWRSLERVRVADWLRKWSGDGTFNKIWLPLLKSKLGECYQETSAAFIWATIARMYAARQTGLKKEMFGYVPGGYARVLTSFAETLVSEGVELRTDCQVREIVAEPGGLVHVASEQGDETFERVVLTAPSANISRLCPHLSASERRRHEGIQYLGIICASVLLDRPLSEFYVTNITDAGLPYTAVIEMTTLVDPQELAGHSLVYLPRYAASNDEAWSWTDEEVEARFRAGLARMYPSFRQEHVRSFRISRVRHVMALPTLNYSETLPAVATGVPNVFVVNSAQIVKGTLNVNEVVALAENALNLLVDGRLTDELLPTSGADDCINAETSASMTDYGPADCELVARSR